MGTISSVVDAMNFRVQVFDRSGNFRYSIGKLGTAPVGCFDRRVSGSIQKGICTSSMAPGASSRYSTSKANCSITLASGEPARANSSCRAGLQIDKQRPRLCCRFLQSPRAGFSLLRYWIERREEAAMRRFLPLVLLTITGLSFGQATPTADVLGVHNLTLGSGSKIYSQGSFGCTFCHAPHSGLGRNLRCGTRSSRKFVCPVLQLDLQ